MFTGQKSSEVVERYKKQALQLKPEQVREAGMLLCPSGRQALRGGENYFGEIEGGGEEDNVGRLHRELIQKKHSVKSIDKNFINNEVHQQVIHRQCNPSTRNPSTIVYGFLVGKIDCLNCNE